ncbi:MAG: hypothetical protein LBN99_00315 [Oscillospiraceae bacterium]|jgi:hypothetical protein|nr:hypothetical protein [Oscillospiraceae bacterium]
MRLASGARFARHFFAVLLVLALLASPAAFVSVALQTPEEQVVLRHYFHNEDEIYGNPLQTEYFPVSAEYSTQMPQVAQIIGANLTGFTVYTLIDEEEPDTVENRALLSSHLFYTEENDVEYVIEITDNDPPPEDATIYISLYYTHILYSEYNDDNVEVDFGEDGDYEGYKFEGLGALNRLLSDADWDVIKNGGSVGFGVSLGEVADNADDGNLRNILKAYEIPIAFFEINITKTVTASGDEPNYSPVTELVAPIVLRVPLGDAQEFELAVVALHDGELSYITTEPNEFGEYIEVIGEYLEIHLARFSSFGVVKKDTDVKIITAAAGDNGRISLSGSVPVKTDEVRLFKITPNPGYMVGSVTVDGANVGAVSEYRLTGDGENHTFLVTFVKIPTPVYYPPAIAPSEPAPPPVLPEEPAESAPQEPIDEPPPVLTEPEEVTPPPDVTPPDVTPPGVGYVTEIPDYDSDGQPTPRVPMDEEPSEGAPPPDEPKPPPAQEPEQTPAATPPAAAAPDDGRPRAPILAIPDSGGGNTPTGGDGPADGWSVVNLLLAVLGLFVPFAELLAAPKGGRKGLAPKGTQILMVLVFTSAIASCLIFTLLEDLGARRLAVNGRTPLFVLLFIIPAGLFAVHVIKALKRAKSAARQGETDT